MAKHIQVYFTQENGSWKGSLEVDDGREPSSRSKIVFPGRRCKSPTEEGSWICQELKDTKPGEPGRGALIVKPLRAVGAIEWHLGPDPMYPELFGVPRMKLQPRKGLHWCEPHHAREDPPEEAQLRLLKANEAYEKAIQRVHLWVLDRVLELDLGDQLSSRFRFPFQDGELVVSTTSGSHTTLGPVLYVSENIRGRCQSLGEMNLEVAPDPRRDWEGAVEVLGEPREVRLISDEVEARWGKVWFRVPRDAWGEFVDLSKVPKNLSVSQEGNLLGDVIFNGASTRVCLVTADSASKFVMEAMPGWVTPIAVPWADYVSRQAIDMGVVKSGEGWRETYRQQIPWLQDAVDRLAEDVFGNWRHSQGHTTVPGMPRMLKRRSTDRVPCTVWSSPSGRIEVTVLEYESAGPKIAKELSRCLSQLTRVWEEIRAGGPKAILHDAPAYGNPTPLSDPRLDHISEQFSEMERKIQTF